jgi:hypothetical protein
MRYTARVPFRLTLVVLAGLASSLLIMGVFSAAPAAGQGIVPGLSLPVFQLLPPAVDPTTAMGLSGRFNTIGSQTVVSDTSRGTLRFTVPNTDTGTIFEQYGASGGFFASNPAVAFGDRGARGPFDQDTAKALACDFLLHQQLFPSEAQGQDCALAWAPWPASAQPSR